MKILVVKLDQVDFIDEGIFQHLTDEKVRGGKAYEKGYIINTNAIMQTVPQYAQYNHFMWTAEQHGFNAVFFNK